MAEPSFIKLYSNFESGTVQQGWQVYEYPSNNPNAMQRSTDRARIGTYSNKITLNSSDSPAQYGNTRTELTYNNSTTPNTALRWYAFSIYMPSATYLPDSKEESIIQWHDKSSSCSTSPPFTIQVKSGRFRAVINYATANYCTASNRKGPFFYDLGAVAYNQWQDFIVYYDPKYDSTGKAQIWINGNLVFNYTGPCHYNGSYFPYLKFGIYKWLWDGSGTTDTTQRIYYVDEVRVGDTGGNLQYFIDAIGGSSGSTTTTTSTSTTTIAGNVNPTVNITSSFFDISESPSILLTAAASDSDGTIASYLWTKVSGGSASILNPTSASTGITGLAAGNYVFGVTVTDNDGGTGSDTISVTVESSNLYKITKS